MVDASRVSSPPGERRLGIARLRQAQGFERRTGVRSGAMRDDRTAEPMSLRARRDGTGLFLLAIGYFMLLGVALLWMRVSPERILLLTLGSIALGIMTFRPYVAVHILLAALFFEFSVDKIGDITVMKLIGTVVLAGWLASILMQRRVGVSTSALLFAMLGFLFWTGLCVFPAFNTDEAVTQFTTYVQMILTAIMFNSVIRTPRHLQGALVGFIAYTVVST